MSSPFFGKNIVDKGKYIFTIPVIILQGNIDDDVILNAFQVDNRPVYGRTIFV